jgi:hypothetical protein
MTSIVFSNGHQVLKLVLKLGVVVLAGAIAVIVTARAAHAEALPGPVNEPSTPGQIGTQPSPEGDDDPIFKKVYAHVNTGDSKVPVFASPEDAVNNAPPVRELNGYEWVTVMNSVEISATSVTQINPNEWVFTDRLNIFRPSKFQGHVFDKTPDHPIAWVLSNFEPALEPEGDANPNAPSYQRYDVVMIYEKAVVGDTIWYRIGDNQWCRQQRLAIVSPRRAPAGVPPRERLHVKWISVNLFEQTIAAYEGERLVYASLVSSGLPQWETVKGVFQIQYKNKSQPMYNAAQDPELGNYYLEEVPYNMFFYQDYALHGAYWHDGFGFRHSRGCVNLAVKDARWLFTWSTPAASEYGYAEADAANPGTWVWVH